MVTKSDKDMRAKLKCQFGLNAIASHALPCIKGLEACTTKLLKIELKFVIDFSSFICTEQCNLPSTITTSMWDNVKIMSLNITVSQLKVATKGSMEINQSLAISRMEDKSRQMINF